MKCQRYFCGKESEFQVGFVKKDSATVRVRSLCDVHHRKCIGRMRWGWYVGWFKHIPSDQLHTCVKVESVR